MDPWGGYVSKILHVKMKESGPVGGARARRVPHRSANANSYLTSLIWPFPLTAFTFGSCLYCASVSQYKDGWAVNFNFFSQKDHRIPQLNTSIMHNTSMIGQRGQWELMVRLMKLSSLGNTRMGDHLATTNFFLLGRKVRQICKICKLTLNYGKT